MSEKTKVVVAECPMSWCDFQSVERNPETGYEAALAVEEHVNNDHSQADIDTLGEPANTDGDAA